ncbi:MAG: recombination protein RecR [Acidobacteria bacterium RIFCSPHIGHO2_12_FULL_67_30]|nr:MAG: recombination protein RecR [Acidobacteria bacterium RIFCSPHIGHO2_02_FULL_67_57]OFV84780.1 MAG: recombination protein RecR [Acidobacteria bacterium RIFCSPHIGHO2_01_FULL_67_28]OFV87068.1 MAG: recombination protein RecR [Acidobacteria bacterium RIFCSPHIGHO2_12_FULL_67_30]
MKELAEPIARLVEELKRLPGVGQKTAVRLAFHLLRQPAEDVERLAQAISTAKQSLRTCSVCHNLTDQDPCEFCRSEARNSKQICVVESAQDIVNVEKTRRYTGLYHVLGGVLAPLDGVGPEQLNIKTLLGRLEKHAVEEVIIATNPTAEGDATALYLAKLIKPLGVRVTRLAMGIPMGGELEYADSVTLQHALDGRREL